MVKRYWLRKNTASSRLDPELRKQIARHLRDMDEHRMALNLACSRLAHLMNDDLEVEDFIANFWDWGGVYR